MEVSAQLYYPAALPQETTPVPIEREFGWAPQPVPTFWRKNFFNVLHLKKQLKYN
jgi:hypothetical protein